MNIFEAYLANGGETCSAFARRIGRAPSTLTRALRGERDPSAKLARAVESGSGGAVSAQAFMAICLAASSKAEGVLAPASCS